MILQGVIALIFIHGFAEGAKFTVGLPEHQAIFRRRGDVVQRANEPLGGKNGFIIGQRTGTVFFWIYDAFDFLGQLRDF